MLEFLKKKGDGTKGGGIKPYLLILGAAVGILLLLFGGSEKSADATGVTTQYKLNRDEIIIYREHLEKEIKALCESVKGVENVTVAVTLSGGFETVYATESTGNGEEYVIVGSGGNASALYLMRRSPEVVGIGIVCRGGGTERVRNELIPLRAATYHLSSHRIYVTEAGS